MDWLGSETILSALQTIGQVVAYGLLFTPSARRWMNRKNEARRAEATTAQKRGGVPLEPPGVSAGPPTTTWQMVGDVTGGVFALFLFIVALIYRTAPPSVPDFTPRSTSSAPTITLSVQNAPAPPPLVEEKPPVAQSALSVPQMRYCLAQGIRIQGADKAMKADSAAEVSRFLALVDDYGPRCRSDRFAPGVLNAVKGAVEARRTALELEGVALIRAGATEENPSVAQGAPPPSAQAASPRAFGDALALITPQGFCAADGGHPADGQATAMFKKTLEVRGGTLLALYRFCPGSPATAGLIGFGDVGAFDGSTRSYISNVCAQLNAIKKVGSPEMDQIISKIDKVAREEPGRGSGLTSLKVLSAAMESETCYIFMRPEGSARDPVLEILGFAPIRNRVIMVLRVYGVTAPAATLESYRHLQKTIAALQQANR
jgi:hypothetical protein